MCATRIGGKMPSHKNRRKGHPTGARGPQILPARGERDLPKKHGQPEISRRKFIPAFIRSCLAGVVIGEHGLELLAGIASILGITVAQLLRSKEPPAVAERLNLLKHL